MGVTLLSPRNGIAIHFMSFGRSIGLLVNQFFQRVGILFLFWQMNKWRWLGMSAADCVILTDKGASWCWLCGINAMLKWSSWCWRSQNQLWRFSASNQIHLVGKKIQCHCSLIHVCCSPFSFCKQMISLKQIHFAEKKNLTKICYENF